MDECGSPKPEAPATHRSPRSKIETTNSSPESRTRPWTSTQNASRAGHRVTTPWQTNMQARARNKFVFLGSHHVIHLPASPRSPSWTTPIQDFRKPRANISRLGVGRLYWSQYIYIGRPQLAEQSIVALGCTVCEECFTTATFVVVVVVIIVAGLLLLRSIIAIVVFMRRNHNFLSALPSDLPSE